MRHSRVSTALRSRLRLCAALVLAAVTLAAAPRPAHTPAAAAAPVVPDPIAFELVSAEGVRFVTQPSRTDRKHQPETMVSGVALFDYDNDGLLDIYVVNGATMPGLQKTDERFHNRLFRNKGNWTFEDVTAKAGVAGKGYELGVAVGDYDNDGYEDLFVAGLRQNILYHNNGDGTFTDVTERAGLAKPDPQYGTLWAVAAAFADYDRDGRLDLFVSNYCVWDPETERVCGSEFFTEYCHPQHYQGLPNSLFHNNGDGTFTDVSVASGIRAQIGKGMGIAPADFDGDGWVDFFVANDTLPGWLFMNNRNGTFTESALERGVAYTDRGSAVSGMGVDAKDVDNDGLVDIFESALTWETFPLFHNVGGGRFQDATMQSGVGPASLPLTGWSNGIFDFNNDGWKDLFVAGGDVLDAFGSFRDQVAKRNGLFVNLRNGKFADAAASAGGAFAEKKTAHRGAAFGDIDNDGNVDVLVTDLHGPPEVWRNTSPKRNHWLIVVTQGTKSNRDGMGAKLKLVSASGAQYNHVNTAVGYGCASDRRVHFGLGKDQVVQHLTITWPSGVVQTLNDVAADQVLTVREP
jgi:enediyne biosynthesis protein E4